MKKFEKALSYDDILMRPMFSDIRSRSECSLKAELSKNIVLETPLIASPMDTVTGVDLAQAISRLGGVAILHRYNTIEEQVTDARACKLNDTKYLGAAVGTTGDYMERVHKLIKDGFIDFICIDVAHGHHIAVKEAIMNIKDHYGSSIHIMAGNVATAEAFLALESWGADSIRVGIGGGAICSTRIQTGHGIPSITSIMDCASVAKTAKLIADGGIKNSGDIVKALAAGADFVMIGSLFAGTDEAPGQFLEVNGVKRKVYRGMASREAQTSWRGKSSAPEGISTTVPAKGPLELVFSDLCGGIQSGLSYSGARTIKELQQKAVFVKQTSAGQAESHTHILARN